jgi:hypothetical protein
MGKLGSGVLGSVHAQLGALELAGIFIPEGIEHASVQGNGILRGRAHILGDDAGYTYASPRAKTKTFRRFRGITHVAITDRVLPVPDAST